MIHLIVCEAILLLCVVFHPINGNNKIEGEAILMGGRRRKTEWILLIKGVANEKWWTLCEVEEKRHERNCRCSW